MAEKEKTKRRWFRRDRPADPERESRVQRRAEEFRNRTDLTDVTPLVVHGDEVIGWNDDYDAAKIVGLEDMVPRITLQQVFEEAGMDMAQISDPTGEEEGAEEREFYEDYLRSLPEHIRDKYGL
jgi:hypothetical protein